MRGVTWIKISEAASGEWGIGGRPSDHRSGQGSRGRPRGGGVNTVRNPASPLQVAYSPVTHARAAVGCLPQDGAAIERGRGSVTCALPVPQLFFVTFNAANWQNSRAK